MSRVRRNDQKGNIDEKRVGYAGAMLCYNLYTLWPPSSVIRRSPLMLNPHSKNKKLIPTNALEKIKLCTRKGTLGKPQVCQAPNEP
jgi:hypothetical protein